MAYLWTTGEVITAAKLNSTGNVALVTLAAKTTANTYTDLGVFGTEAVSVSAASINNRVYIVGDFIGSTPDDFVEYNILTNSFSVKAPASVPLVRNPGFANLGGIAYKVGGNNASAVFSDCEKYSPLTNSWTTIATLPATRGYLDASATRDFLYATGGRTTFGGSATSDCLQYDPSANTWTSKASMANARYNHLGSGALDKIFVISGAASGSTLTSCEQYNESTNTWTTKAAVSAPTLSSTSIKYGGSAPIFGFIYHFRGSTSQYLDVSANTWSSVANITFMSGLHAVGYSDDAAYFFNSSFDSVRRYNPDVPGKYKPASEGIAFTYGASPPSIRNNISGQSAAIVTFKTDEWIINTGATPIDTLILGG
jgi:hypothetical protein